MDTIATGTIDGPTAADTAAPMVDAVFQGAPSVQIVFWDGSAIGPAEGPGQIVIKSPEALRRIMWAPGELGFARAYIAGDLDVVGPIGEVLRAFQASLPAEADDGTPPTSELKTALDGGTEGGDHTALARRARQALATAP